jgi:hypothetical protein
MACEDLDQAQRDELAAKGHAMEDTSYPMPDCQYVKCALLAFERGQVADSHRHKLAILIRQRDEDLGCGLDLDSLKEY